MAPQHSPAPADGGGYREVRNRRSATLTDDERKVYQEAYREAGWAMDLAELVYTTRTDAGLTQKGLAVAMGTSQSAIAAWENGARTPGVEALERLAKACGKTLTSLSLPHDPWARTSAIARLVVERISPRPRPGNVSARWGCPVGNLQGATWWRTPPGRRRRSG